MRLLAPPVAGKDAPAIKTHMFHVYRSPAPVRAADALKRLMRLRHTMFENTTEPNILMRLRHDAFKDAITPPA